MYILCAITNMAMSNPKVSPYNYGDLPTKFTILLQQILNMVYVT